MPTFKFFWDFRRRSLTALVIAGLLGLTACGFQLRGIENVKFHRLYIQGAGLTISKALIKSLAVNSVQVVSDPDQAELILELVSESTEKKILSLSGVGTVSEYEIFYRVRFRLRDPSSELWGPLQVLEQRRDYSYGDTQLLAKSTEEGRLYEDMRADAVRQLMRLLIVQKPKPRTGDSDAQTN